MQPITPHGSADPKNRDGILGMAESHQDRTELASKPYRAQVIELIRHFVTAQAGERL
jgi:hypothetical protein